MSLFFNFVIGSLEMESKDYKVIDSMSGINRVHGNSKCTHNVDKNIKCFSSYSKNWD